MYNKNDQISKKSRILYRINREKLNKYRSQYNNKHVILNENKENNIIPVNKILLEKIIDRKTISTQTTFTNEINSSTDLITTLSIILKTNQSTTINDDNNEDIKSQNTFSSLSDISKSSFSSLSLNINKTIINNSNSSSIEFDLHNQSNNELSIKTDSNQFNNHISKSQPTNCRIYIRSFIQHMLSDDISNENLY